MSARPNEADGQLTRLRNTDADLAAGKIVAAEGQRGFQSIQRRKFHVPKPFGLAIQLVLNNADICDLAVFKEVTYVSLCGIE
jgi:hypothetical protein